MEFGKKQNLKPTNNGKPICKYGNKCYRKHPSHLQEFSHPSDDQESVPIVKKAEPPKKVTGKITDFFGKQSCSKELSPQRKKLRQASQIFEEDSDFSIEDPFENNEIKSENKKPISECTQNKRPKLSSPVRAEEPNISGLAVNECAKENSSSDTGNFKNEKILSKKEPCHSKKELSDDEIIIINELIEDLFLVKMPSDFFHFWNFCLLIKRSNPKDAVLNWLGFTLVGPFDILINNLSKNNFKHLNDESKEQLLCHWRYFFDTPEFQTVLKGTDENGFHIGYFRDDPKEAPVFLASNEATKSYIINPIGDNLFCVIQHFLTKTVRSSGTNAGLDALQRRLTEFCKKHNIALSNNNMKARNERIVAKPFHNAGMVVPFENDVGYRELPLNKSLSHFR
ncbi:UPF0609 protein C4orf27-like protein [Leptotrombidium deliense]|uniref:UPF0609 protein C4orf27-like protein n=1 Tax=Leptotrombidium deliense TaxID=299467 RepID=A0A443S4D0_9ACAR|nr:UPF0609 protein C4orf27-like protein [Leptotrombidium deliense]